jgi:hypothetical protein
MHGQNPRKIEAAIHQWCVGLQMNFSGAVPDDATIERKIAQKF